MDAVDKKTLLMINVPSLTSIFLKILQQLLLASIYVDLVFHNNYNSAQLIINFTERYCNIVLSPH